MADNSREHTHSAYGLRRETRISGRWLQIGGSRFEIDTAAIPEHLKPLLPQLKELLQHVRAHVVLDRTILGSFSGHIYVLPANEPEPVFNPQPQRPAQASEDEPDLLSA